MDRITALIDAEVAKLPDRWDSLRLHVDPEHIRSLLRGWLEIYVSSNVMHNRLSDYLDDEMDWDIHEHIASHLPYDLFDEEGEQMDIRIEDEVLVYSHCDVDLSAINAARVAECDLVVLDEVCGADWRRYGF